MKWLALLGKELQQHGAAVAGALLLLASVQVVTWGVSFFENRLTLMNTVETSVLFPGAYSTCSSSAIPPSFC